MNNLTTASGRPVRDSSLGRSMPAAEWYRNEYERTVSGVAGNICAWFNIDYDSAFELFFNALIDSDIIQAIKLHCERSLNSSFK